MSRAQDDINPVPSPLHSTHVMSCRIPGSHYVNELSSTQMSAGKASYLALISPGSLPGAIDTRVI